jgi:hypothetical protein
MFFKQNAPQIPKKILKARYARAATQPAGRYAASANAR